MSQQIPSDAASAAEAGEGAASPVTAPTDAAFRAFRRFNDPALAPLTGLRRRLGNRARPYFEGDGMPERLARALCDEQAIPIKELFESFELFERVRRRLRAPAVADLCCGHGLTGVLFAIFVPEVERVMLVDQRRPQSTARVLRAVEQVAPWAPPKVEYVERKLQRLGGQLPEGASVLALHACGKRTDQVISLATEASCDMALMPCCYFGTAHRAPKAVRRALGSRLSTDIDRTYRLEASGYRVEWGAIPRAITEMNRVLVAQKR